jgi:hypothetical protein
MRRAGRYPSRATVGLVRARLYASGAAPANPVRRVARLPHPGWGESPPPGHTVVSNFARNCARSRQTSAGSAPILAPRVRAVPNDARPVAVPGYRTTPGTPLAGTTQTRETGYGR